MRLIPVRTADPKDLPWAKNSIYRYSAQNRFPEIIIKVDGKLFFDMDAFEERVTKARDHQVKKAEAINRSVSI